ncbi:hypothetical protein GOBAR_DD04462 [Gossypium barbadense]|nr:hypothetical protein GOBAR_DD04462 [Gossypium barbadense]
MDNIDIKLLGRNIGLPVLQNKIYNLWKPLSPFHLMDIENGYFLPKFNNKLGYKKVLSKGLSGYRYKHKILVEIEGLVGQLDFRAQYKDPLNELDFKNLVGPSKLKQTIKGPKVGLFWSRKQTNSPRPLDYGSFLNLRENKLVLGIKLSQEIGSSTGLTVSEDLPIHYLAVEKFGRQQQSVAAIIGSEIKAWTSDGGSIDSELIILNGGNSCALESLARLSSTLQGLV